MTTSVKFKDYCDAGVSLIVVRTCEEMRAYSALAAECLEHGLSHARWDVANGGDFGDANPQAFLEALIARAEAIIAMEESADSTEDVIFALDLHKLLQSPVIERLLLSAIALISQVPISLVLIAPSTKLSEVIERHAVVYDFTLPSAKELEHAARELVALDPTAKVSDKVFNECGIAARGLTLPEAINAFSVSMIVHKSLNKDLILAEKLQAVKKSGLMEIYEPEDEANVGGLAELKKYIHARKIGFEDNDYPTPKGVLLVGPPGSGKSLAAKMIAKIINVPLLRLDFSSLKSRYVGDSEARVKQVLNLIDVISPCVVWMDEIEKSLGGVQSSDVTDGGTGSAMFGQLLTWMQEANSTKYIVATSNDVQPLLNISQGALLRRFDDIFFVDLPNTEERKEILKIQNKRYKADIPEDWADHLDNFTGAEIEKLCACSKYEGADRAKSLARTVYAQNKTLIDSMRNWANKNARPANAGKELVAKPSVRSRRLRRK